MVQAQLPTWKLLLASISSLILTMGIARFALTPLLPAMQLDTGLGDDGAGFLAAFNYAGYLSGAFLASTLHSPLVKIRCYRWGVVLAVLTTTAMAFTENVVVWSALRYLSGLTTAAGMVICSALVMEHLKQRNCSDYIGLHFGGVGLGVILSGGVLTWSEPVIGWGASWVVLGAISFILALPALAWITADGLSAPGTGNSHVARLPRRQITYLLIAYGFAGASMSIGTTFFIAILADNPSLAESRHLAWVLLGVALTPSCIFWVKMAAGMGEAKALVLAYIVQAVGCALPVLIPSQAGALVGGFLYGACFMGIVSVVLSLGGKLSPHNPSALIGILVVSYGVGQIAGPVLVGIAMEALDFSALGLWSAAVCSLFSIVFSLLNNDLPTSVGRPDVVVSKFEPDKG